MDMAQVAVAIPDPQRIDVYLPFADTPILVTKAWSAERPEEEPVIEGVASSTIKDTQGDEFTHNFLKAMCTEIDGVGLWPQHSYRMPDDHMGWLAGMAYELKSGDIGLVRAQCAMEMDNPPAERSYKFIKKGRVKMGLSGGFEYLDFKALGGGPRGRPKGFRVNDGRCREMSITPLPSNPLAWLDLAQKSLVAKSIIDPREDQDQFLYRVKRIDDFYSVDPIAAVQFERMIMRLEESGLYLGVRPTERRSW